MPGDVVVAGCGNLLRGDDAAGPLLVRKIRQLGCPDGVRLVDGGTAGMDIALQMDGAREVVIVDACVSGSNPGETFEVAGAEVESLPLGVLNMHAFRWDHAISFARWLLGDRYPSNVIVFLIEAKTLDAGAGLSPEVERSVEALALLLVERYGGGRGSP